MYFCFDIACFLERENISQSFQVRGELAGTYNFCYKCYRTISSRSVVFKESAAQFQHPAKFVIREMLSLFHEPEEWLPHALSHCCGVWKFHWMFVWFKTCQSQRISRKIFRYSSLWKKKEEEIHVWRRWSITPPKDPNHLPWDKVRNQRFEESEGRIRVFHTEPDFQAWFRCRSPWLCVRQGAQPCNAGSSWPSKMILASPRICQLLYTAIEVRLDTTSLNHLGDGLSWLNVQINPCCSTVTFACMIQDEFLKFRLIVLATDQLRLP